MSKLLKKYLNIWILRQLADRQRRFGESNPVNPGSLLRLRLSHCDAEQQTAYEFPAPHSITSSTRAGRHCGITKPSGFRLLQDDLEPGWLPKGGYRPVYSNSLEVEDLIKTVGRMAVQ